jgi:WS/DGAT/MGAT family acyltransferase
MARYTYERLSAQDNSFLIFESPKTHMHVSSTLVYDLGPLRLETGGVDFDRIKRATEGYLHRIPRYRQKLHFVPLTGDAVWVDDRHFSLDYHVRHTALPKPGTDAQLKALSSRIMAQPLDRSRPLWETWVVEGLEGDRFAVITKIHHCMIDGASGVDIATVMMSNTADREIPDVPRFIPRPAPSNSELLRDELWRRGSLPLDVLRDIRRFAAESENFREEVMTRVNAVRSLLGMGLTPDDTPINGSNGPHRDFDWLNVPLAELKAIRKALGATINDVVLTVVTGAVREYMQLRGVNPATIDFRVSAPVSVRTEEERGQLGNRVSSWILSLPIDEQDPVRQLERIHAITQELKSSRQALGVEMMMRVAEWTPAVLLSLGSQASMPTNTIVTNVPGPQFPLYLQGAELKAIYPQVPLLEGLGLGIALMSYNGRVCWGLNADPDIVPDVADFRKLLAKSLDNVALAAGVDVDREAGEVAGSEEIEGPRIAEPAPKTRTRGNGAPSRPSPRAGPSGP